MRSRKWIEKEEFEKQLTQSREAKIVLFAADWCGYCKKFMKLIDEYKPQPGDSSAEIEIVNIDSGDGSLWDEYQVPLVPTIAVFREGKELFRRNGKPGIGLTKSELEEAVGFKPSSFLSDQ